MSLIKVKEIGYGLKGDTLDITIAIPKGSYLKSFWVGSQNDAKKANCTTMHIGIDYIKAIMDADATLKYDIDAFKVMFSKQCEYTDVATGNVYDIYKINSTFAYTLDGVHIINSGIKVSQLDVNFITMELDIYSVTNDFVYSTQCSEDIMSLTVPLFNLMPLRLKVLDESKFIEDRCEMPRSFIDKLLQLKTIELSLACKDYCKTLKYWDKFFGEKSVKDVKKCGCHGGDI